MFILRGVGSNRAIRRNFLLSVTLKKITAERNDEKLNKNRQLNNHPKLFRMWCRKSSIFKKFSKTGNTGGKVLLSVKFQGLIQKCLHQGCFPASLPSVPRTPTHHRFYRLIFLVQKTFCWGLTFAFMKCIYPKVILL